MTNKWIEHVKQYAKDNSLSYACALTNKDMAQSYVKIDKKTKKQKMEEKDEEMMNFVARSLKNRIKNMNDGEKASMKMKFNSTNKRVKEIFQSKYSKYYNKLFSLKNLIF